MEEYQFRPIGWVKTCFKEKFGIPRQPGLAPSAIGVLKLRPDPNLKTAIQKLESFSHLWLIFVFHQPGSKAWKPSIRPPRLGGARKVGVLASRSPHRPNPIGLSAVELDRIEIDAPGGPEIYLKGVDLLDGTPILDIKPYLPYADSIPDANPGWAHQEITRTPVEFSEKAQTLISEYSEAEGIPHLKTLILEILELDPRPAFQKLRMPPGSPESEGLAFGFKLLKWDIQWVIREGKFLVTDLLSLG